MKTDFLSTAKKQFEYYKLLGEKTFDQKIMSYRPDCFELVGYQSHPKIKAPLSN